MQRDGAAPRLALLLPQEQDVRLDPMIAVARDVHRRFDLRSERLLIKLRTCDRARMLGFESFVEFWGRLLQGALPISGVFMQPLSGVVCAERNQPSVK
jgi:hypothetical protein